MDALNHALLIDVVVTNDKMFSEIAIKKAKMMLCVAKNNKNIKISFENAVKINAYNTTLKLITAKKAKSLIEYVLQDDMRIPMSSYREKVIKIKIELQKENMCVIEGVKENMIIEQLQNIIKYYKKINKLLEIVSNLGINVERIDDITNITGEVGDICESDQEYGMEDYHRHFISTIFKYNAYCMNMLFNYKITEDNEKDIIKYVCAITMIRTV
jgi:hypothetical protein